MMMKRAKIFKTERIEVVSLGNGLAYEIHDNWDKVSAFVQGDDAAALRDELDCFPDGFPLEAFYLEQIAIRQ
jgi:hypothetical protein